MGTGFGLAIVVGASVGVGILRVPGLVAAQVENVALILTLWLFGGLYALIGANSFAEMATALPQAGGNYVYLKRAYGSFFGFAGGMNDYVLSSCGAAYIAIAASEYAGALLPALTDHESLVAVVLISAVAGLNWIGLRAGDRAQKAASLAKMVGLVLLAAGCFWIGSGSDGSLPTVPSSPHPLLGFAATALAFQAVMETYAGWNSAVYFSEETVDSGKSVPRSLFLGVIAITLVYVLVNAGLLYALSLPQLAGSKLPAADAAGLLFGSAGARVIALLALLSLLGILNSMLLYMPRILFAISRDGFLPPKIATVNTGGTPVAAMLMTAGLIAVLALSGTFETLLAIAAFLGLAGDSLCYLALFVLRRREPDLPRPYRALGYPVLPAIVLIGGLILLTVYILGNPFDSVVAVLILVAFYPIYLVCRRRWMGSAN